MIEAKSARYMGRIQTSCSTRIAVSWERCRHSSNFERTSAWWAPITTNRTYRQNRRRHRRRNGARYIDILIYGSCRDSQFSKFRADIYTYPGPFFLLKTSDESGSLNVDERELSSSWELWLLPGKKQYRTRTTRRWWRNPAGQESRTQ